MLTGSGCRPGGRARKCPPRPRRVDRWDNCIKTLPSGRPRCPLVSISRREQTACSSGSAKSVPTRWVRKAEEPRTAGPVSRPTSKLHDFAQQTTLLPATCETKSLPRIRGTLFTSTAAAHVRQTDSAKERRERSAFAPMNRSFHLRPPAFAGRDYGGQAGGQASRSDKDAAYL